MSLYNVPDIKFANTREFTRTAQYFEKHGVYTKANPKYDKKDFNEFWDIEEDRLINGMSVAGESITGEHYGYLNYGQIKLTKGKSATSIKNELKDAGVIKSGGLSASKTIGFPSFYDYDRHQHRRRPNNLRMMMIMMVMNTVIMIMMVVLI